MKKREYGNDGHFKPHRDTIIKRLENYFQVSCVICLDAKISKGRYGHTPPGCTEVYDQGKRHIFDESCTPGKGIYFPSSCLHSVVGLAKKGDYVIKLKFDILYPEINYSDDCFTSPLCNCINCDKESNYNKELKDKIIKPIFKKINLPEEINDYIKEYLGDFIKCNCRHRITGSINRQYENCGCDCINCKKSRVGYFCRYSMDCMDYYCDDYDDYDDERFGYCNGDD